MGRIVPELPEVETIRRGIEPHAKGRRIVAVAVRNARLRWPVPGSVKRAVGQRIKAVERRGKYLLLKLERGALLLHFGMSGSLAVVRSSAVPAPHDHVDLCLEGGWALRLNDPRRFGALLWLGRAGQRHPLLAHLGPEPLDHSSLGEHLWRLSRRRRVAVKTYLMDSRVVAGVGNIYASEVLFRAGLRPTRPVGRVNRADFVRLAEAVREVLAEAVRLGGTTLRNYRQSNGRPGYFKQRLAVYGRAGEPCVKCSAPLRRLPLSGRATYFCPACQI